jgi:hypothetical protein
MLQAVKAALVAATLIAPAREAISATFTVHEPDGEGRVFVDILGTINDGDFQTFKDKTDQIYPIGPGHPKKQVIVTLWRPHKSRLADRRLDTQKTHVHLRPWGSRVCQRVRTHLARRSATNRW